MGHDDPIPGWLSQMQDDYMAGNYTGALAMAEQVLERDRQHEEAATTAARCRSVLTDMLLARLGPTDRRVQRLASDAELRWTTLDPPARQLLELADGAISLGELLARSGPDRLRALQLLANLVERRILALGAVPD